MVKYFWIIAALTACDTTPAGLDGDPAGSSIADPPAPDAMFVVPDASLSISPSPGAHDWEPGQVAWVVDTSPNGARCVIEPLPSACTSDPDGFLLAGDGSSIGTEYDCLCADVVCEDALTGVPMATWTWDLGRVCDP